MAKPQSLLLATTLLAFLWGCPDSHPGLDAARDAGTDTERDAGIDAPPECLDRDEDGFTDAACGGDDCDDGDPLVTPEFSECTGPTSVRACEMGRITDRACPTIAPLCDLRLGRCATDACGDGVLHPGEECEDQNDNEEDGCSSSCQEVPCLGSTQCPPGRESCSDRREDGNVYCQPLRDVGEPLGARCFDDADCATGWCDETDNRCTAACAEHDDCPVDLGLCLQNALYEARPVCGFGCRSTADCLGELRCTWDSAVERGGIIAHCAAPIGTRLTGEYCRSPLECVSNSCGWSVGCSTTCTEDSHCESPEALGPECYVGSMRGFAAPDDWSIDLYGVCRPRSL